ncbi:MAG: ATP-binding protein [Vicinamibacteraceae bacterium]
MDEKTSDPIEADASDLYENAPCAFLSTLPDGTIVRVNQTFLAWSGRPAEALIGRVRFQTLLTVGGRMYYETHYAPLLQMQGFVNEIALDMRRADGSVCPVVASARQLRGPDGTVTVNRIALFDSSDRRRYERELLVARKRAEESARSLAEADRRRNEFLAVLGHELRNPLAPIRSGLEILRRVPLDERIKSTVTGMMQRQVAQMTRLVEDLLDVSRIGQDQFALRRVPVDLSSVVHNAIEGSETLLDGAGLTFTATLPTIPIYADADASRLAQAIGNILNNAAKFTPRGGAVALTLERSDDDALIRVRDSGIGLDEQQLPLVFELFMQAKSSSSRRDGLGIGLTLARNLVERHDGRITVHSDGLGKGTEFTIRLPARTGALQSASHAFSRTPAAAAPSTPRRILIVDDDHDSTELMRLSLELYGHEIQIAHDGHEAVDTSATFQPHLVLLDIGLPTIDGYEAARRIRARPGAQPVLVALTGWGQDEDRRKSAAAGFDLHLVKPVDHDALMALIAELPAPLA